MTMPSGGIPSVDVAEARRRLEDDPRSVVVDVREPNEFEAIRLDGAALFPLSTFGLRFEQLPRDRPILVMCAAGSRSLAATAHLLRNGWQDVVNVTGGLPVPSWNVTRAVTRYLLPGRNLTRGVTRLCSVCSVIRRSSRPLT